MQVPDAWPNTFRQSRFLSAVDFVQADRLRRKVAVEMERIFSEVDLLLVPSLRDEFLVITNFTGHPSLTLRAGFVEVSEARSDWAPNPKKPLPKFTPPRRVPYGVTLVGRLFEEGLIAEAGIAMERAFNVAASDRKGSSFRFARHYFAVSTRARAAGGFDDCIGMIRVAALFPLFAPRVDMALDDANGVVNVGRVSPRGYNLATKRE